MADGNNEDNNQHGNKEAADLVRKKLDQLYGQYQLPPSQHIYGQDDPSRTEDNNVHTEEQPHYVHNKPEVIYPDSHPNNQTENTQSPQEIYRHEQQIQDEIEPQYHHSNPDHQLPSYDGRHSLENTDASGFKSFPLPGMDTAEPQANQQHSHEPQQAEEPAIINKWHKPAQHPASKIPVHPTDKRKLMRPSLREHIKRMLSGSESSSNLKSIKRTVIAAVLVFLLYNSQVIFGQVQYYVRPGDTSSTPVIIDPELNTEVGPEPKIIIPKINVDVPVVYDETSYDERRIQAALERGVVHYGGTAAPGQKGNTVIIGHSSNSFWNGGKYKFAFVLLDRLNKGDTFAINYKGKQYLYEVFSKKVVEPDNFSVISQNYDQPVATLITCTPPGTAWKRLAVTARQISPDPEQEKPDTNPNPEIPEQIDAPIPGNTPSLWDRFRDWIF